MHSISGKIVHMGGYKVALDTVIDLMRSEYPCSVIIRGNAGSGKKTVIAEASRETGVKCIDIDPLQYTEDFGAFRRIVEELGLKPRANVCELIDEIRENAARDDKLVIVLHCFEDFCRKRQSLLYNLMNLLHTSVLQDGKGPNVTLIGLTTCLDWAENLEKRVRSRLNAKLIELSYPYKNLEEYVEFTSKLLNDYEIDALFRDQLAYMYAFGSESITYLKRYLQNITTVNARGKLVVKFDPERYKQDYQSNFNILLKRRLLDLTRPQLELLKNAIQYYVDKDAEPMTLSSLNSYLLNKKSVMREYKEENDLMFRDAAYLVKLGLFDYYQGSDQTITFDTKLIPMVTNKQFKAVIQMDSALKFLIK